MNPDYDLKTFEGTSDPLLDPIYAKQKQDVAKMRTSLLACDLDPKLATTSLKSIAVLRVYHQVSRIIQYTELMDKLEAKLYQAIDHQIDNMDIDRPTTWMTLLNIQERLQKNMIESQKLLQPFMDLTEFTCVENDNNAPTTTISLDANKREKLRTSARAVLQELNVG